MNILHDIDSKRITPEQFIACIEISKGSKMKYEVDKETGLLRLDRVLYTSTHYPENYGFIPRTYSDDGDALDVLVMCQEPIVPMTLVKCYPIGLIQMVDSDETDEKIIAIACDDPSLNCYKSISDLPLHILDEIRHFFGVYKQLEGKVTTIQNILGVEEAKTSIENSIKLYNKVFKERGKI